MSGIIYYLNLFMCADDIISVHFIYEDHQIPAENTTVILLHINKRLEKMCKSSTLFR